MQRFFASMAVGGFGRFSPEGNAGPQRPLNDFYASDFFLTFSRPKRYYRSAMKRRKPIRYAISRRNRNLLFFLLVFVLLPLLAALDHWVGPPARRAIEQAFFYTADQRKYHRQTFAVARVIDGDTLDLDVPDGNSPFTRVRLLGIDTPETKHPRTGVMYFGPEAAAFAESLAGSRKATVLMDTVGDSRDFYGRLLAYIQLEDGRILNEEIVRCGYGYADLRFDHSCADRYEQLMDQAIQAKIGLWKEVARDQLPSWLRQKRPLLLR